MRGLAVCILMLGLACQPTASLARNYCDFPNYDTLDSVVKVLGAKVEGSGVVVADNLVITAAHVIEGEPLLNVEVRGVPQYAELISTMPDSDLALLKVNTRGQRPLRLAPLALQPEDVVWTVGFPLGGSQLTSRGVFEGELKENGRLKTTASVNHGQSGGGLLSCINGEYVLAGVIHAFGAINMGDHYIRLDDYSVSVPVTDIMALMYAAAGR